MSDGQIAKFFLSLSFHQKFDTSLSFRIECKVFSEKGLISRNDKNPRVAFVRYSSRGVATKQEKKKKITLLKMLLQGLQ